MKTENKINEKYLDKIIRAAYGDASFIEKAEIFFKSLTSKQIKNIYEEYKTTVAAVHSHKLEKIELNNLPNIKRTKDSFAVNIISLITIRPIKISYASIVLILGVTALFLFNGKNNEMHYTQKEMLKAEQDVKYSLAIVGKVFSETKNILNKDIVNDKIRKPIKIGFQTINNLYN